MSFILRDYQKEAVIAALKFLKGNSDHNAIEVLPTGSGKSLVIANIIRGLQEPTLVFQPSKEILEQNYGKLISYGYDATIYSASLNSKRISDITYATIGSVKNNPGLFRDFKYVIIDECHLCNSKEGMYRDFLAFLVGHKALGLTATPYRLTHDGFGGSILKFLTRTRPSIFKEMIYYVQNKYLFDNRYLAKLQYYSLKGFDRNQLVLNSTGADYTEQSVLNYYRNTKFRDKVVKVVSRLFDIKRKNALVFTRFVEEADYVTKYIPKSEILTAETKKSERERVIKYFRSGDIKAVCNVGILTTGFDYPELETVVLGRPTMSLALYYQMIGRSIRPHPNKEYAMIVDMCNNYQLFGKIEELTIDCDGKTNKNWFIRNTKRQLTNVYLQRY